MSNELIETDAPIENTGAEATETPEVVAPEATEGADTKPAEPAKSAEQIEIERLRRALTKRDRTQGKLHQELEQYRSREAQQAQRQPAPETSEAKPEARVDEREVLTLAEQIADRKAFDAKCNSVASEGKKEFADFTDALNTLIEEAGPIVGTNGSPTALGEAVLDSDSPAKLIHYLGKHPEIAAELDGLSTARIGRKLALIEQEMNAKPKTSAAPKPIEPVVGRATSALSYSPDMTDAQFAKWRKAQRGK